MRRSLWIDLYKKPEPFESEHSKQLVSPIAAIIRLWLPVGDETNGKTTYSGGRYLYDTTKGANLGSRSDGRRILLDFNFLYPPSCALNDSWICPLCPPANRLPFKLEAGERTRSA